MSKTEIDYAKAESRARYCEEQAAALKGGDYHDFLMLAARCIRACIKLASFEEGPIVTGSFDDPNSARVARCALTGDKAPTNTEAEA